MQEFESFLLAVLLYAGTTALGIVGYLYSGTIDHPGLGLDVFVLFSITALFLVGLRYTLNIIASSINDHITQTRHMKGR